MQSVATPITLFISHSSRDATLANAFARLIKTVFDGVRSEQIVCTSVEGHRLAIGDIPRDKLAEKLVDSVVVALLTPRSVESSWVLFELGAAWGLSRRVLPILHGLSHVDCPAALQGTIAAVASNTSDVHAVVDEIAQAFSWKLSASAKIPSAVAEFVAIAASVNDIPAERLLFRSEVVKELPWAIVAKQVQQELYIWAWSGVGALNERTRNTFQAVLTSGKTINFMILSPLLSKRASEALRMEPVCSWSADEIHNDIINGRKALLEFRAGLKPETHRNFHIRETSWFMAWSGLAIDPSISTGILQIENYLYNYAASLAGGNHLDFRPNLLLTHESKFFDPYWRSIENMWNAATPVL